MLRLRGPSDPPEPALAAGEPPDADLVARARAGDRGAMGSLYDRHARTVKALLLARVPPADADDLTQDVFLIAMRRLGTLRDDSAFAGWVLSVARRRAATFGRGAWRRLRRSPAPSDEPAAPPAGGADRREVLAALRSLPRAYRDTLALRLMADLSGPEIARRMGMTHGSVRVNLARGLRLLRERLGWEDNR